MNSVAIFDSVGARERLPWRIERKFYIEPQKVELVRGLLNVRCRPDAAFPAEQINSLYFDSDELEQYERSQSGDFLKHKVRLRWYGSEPEMLDMMQTVFLELKSREGFASRKQRLEMKVPTKKLFPPYIEEGVISGNLLTELLARFGYFPVEPLRPVIQISYFRYRYRDIWGEMSIALDCNIRSVMMRPCGDDGGRLALTGAVLEIKGKSMEVPLPLKKLGALGIGWSRFSKYSACIDAHRDQPGSSGWLSPAGLNVKA